MRFSDDSTVLHFFKKDLRFLEDSTVLHFFKKTCVSVMIAQCYIYSFSLFSRILSIYVFLSTSFFQQKCASKIVKSPKMMISRNFKMVENLTQAILPYKIGNFSRILFLSFYIFPAEMCIKNSQNHF